MRVDWLIVGAGLTGCTLAERIASELDERVLIVERREHIGGNAYDFYNEEGILVHKYGPHIFHTNLKQVWDYLSRFTEWRPYHHRVLAVVDGCKVPLPFNLNSLYAVFPPGYAAKLENLLIEQFGFGATVPILNLKEHAKDDLRFLANYIYEKVFRGYTLKQWGAGPEGLDPSVTGRVPIRVSRDDRYFTDAYQAIPRHGYSAMFRRMTRHKNISVLLKTDYRDIAEEIQYKRMVYTGAIDEFFGYRHGPLPYRSARFVFATLGQEWYQEVGTVNYPNDYEFTRITEYKHLSGQVTPKTTLSYEYPQAYVEGENDRCYPVLQHENVQRHALYIREAEALRETVLFAGRLADYKYYNMDEAVARALSLFVERIAR